MKRLHVVIIDEEFDKGIQIFQESNKDNWKELDVAFDLSAAIFNGPITEVGVAGECRPIFRRSVINNYNENVDMDSTAIELAKVDLIVELNIWCPFCNSYFDLLDMPWRDILNVVIECPECMEKIDISGIE